MMRVFESRMLRRIFGPKRDEVTGSGGDFCIEELHELYRSPKETLGQGLRQAWGKGNVHTGFWWGNLRERYNLEVPGVDERAILIWIFKK